MKIAVILARSGSKRIPKKNIKNFKGKPMIYWPIAAAKKSKFFDRIIVSTDSKQIARISKKYGAEIPFLRSKKLANDFTGTTKVVSHLVNWLNKKYQKPKTICCIYACAPFLQSKDIRLAYNKFKKGNWDYIFAATIFNQQVLRSFSFNKKGGINMIFKNNYNKRTQDLKKVAYDAGQFYWGKAETWRKEKKIFHKNSSVIFIPSWRSIDINTKDDWKLAIKLQKSRNI